MICTTAWGRRKVESQCGSLLVSGPVTSCTTSAYEPLDPSWAPCWHVMLRWEASVSCALVSLTWSLAGIPDLSPSSVFPLDPGLGFHPKASAIAQPHLPKASPMWQTFSFRLWPIALFLWTHSKPTAINPPGKQGSLGKPNARLSLPDQDPIGLSQTTFTSRGAPGNCVGLSAQESPLKLPNPF